MAIDLLFNIAQRLPLSVGYEFRVSQAGRVQDLIELNRIVAEVAGPDEVYANVVGVGTFELAANFVGQSTPSDFVASFTVEQENICKVYKGKLLKYLPAEFEVHDKDSDLQDYLEVIAISADEFYCFIEKFTEVFDADRCEPRYLVYLAKLIGYPLSTRGFDSTTPSVQEASIRRARIQLKQAVEVYKRKGLKEAFQILFYSLGYYIELIELWTNNYITFLSEVPPTETLYHTTKNPNGWYKSPYFGIKLYQVSQTTGTVCTTTDSGAGQSGGWSEDDLAEVLEAVHQIRPVHTVLWWLEYFFDLCDQYEFTEDAWEIGIESAFVDKFFDCAPDDPIYYRDDERLVGVTRNGTDSLAITHVRDPQEGFCDGDYQFIAEIGEVGWQPEPWGAEVLRNAGEYYRDGSNTNPRNGINPTRDPSAFERRNGGRSIDFPLTKYFTPPTVVVTPLISGDNNYTYYVVAHYSDGFLTIGSAEATFTHVLIGTSSVQLDWDSVGDSYDIYRFNDGNLVCIASGYFGLSYTDSGSTVGGPAFPDPVMSSLIFDRSGVYTPAQDTMDPLYQIGEEAEDGVVAYYNHYEFTNWLDTMVLGPGIDPPIQGRNSGFVPTIQLDQTSTDPRNIFGNSTAAVGLDLYSLFGSDPGGVLSRTVTKLPFIAGILGTPTLLTPTGFTSKRYAGGVTGVYQNKIYYMAGHYALNATPTVDAGLLSDVIIFDPSTNTLTQAAWTLMTPRIYTASAQVGSKLYLFGGNANTLFFVGVVTEVDLSTGIQVDYPLPQPMQYACVVAVNEFIYLINGAIDDDVYDLHLYRFSTITKTFEIVADVDPLYASANTRGFLYKGNLFFIPSSGIDYAVRYNLISSTFSIEVVKNNVLTNNAQSYIERVGRFFGTGAIEGEGQNNKVQVITII